MNKLSELFRPNNLPPTSEIGRRVVALLMSLGLITLTGSNVGSNKEISNQVAASSDLDTTPIQDDFVTTDQLPESYQRIIEVIASDPIVGAALNSGVSINFQRVGSADESSEYDGADITIALSPEMGPEELGITVVHEAVHAIFGSIQSGFKYQEEISTIDKASRRLIELGIQDALENDGDNLQIKINNFVSQVEQQRLEMDDETYSHLHATGGQWLAAAREKKQDKFVKKIISEGFSGTEQTVDANELLQNLMTAEDYTSPRLNAVRSDLSEILRVFQKGTFRVAKSFDESEIAAGSISELAGHPDSSSEMVASLLTASQLYPQSLVDRINNEAPEVRAATRDLLLAIHQALEAYFGKDPTNTVYVAAGVDLE